MNKGLKFATLFDTLSHIFTILIPYIYYINLSELSFFPNRATLTIIPPHIRGVDIDLTGKPGPHKSFQNNSDVFRLFALILCIES